jgi:flagellin
MALTISSNVSTLRAARHLSGTQKALANTLGRLSSGLRVHRAADDAAGLAVATNLKTKAQGYTMGMRNMQDGVSMLSTMEGALDEVVDMTQHLRELAVQASSETLHNDERAYIEEEKVELHNEIDRINATIEFNGTSLTGSGTLSVQVGPDNDPDHRIDINLFDLNTNGFGMGTTLLLDPTSARDAIDAYDTALNSLNSHRSKTGASMNRLFHALDHAAVTAEQHLSSAGKIQDADYAVETSNLAKLQIMQQAGVAALAKAKNLNQSVLSLIG